MEHLDQVVAFINGKDFFYYHGYGLTLLWIVASTISILAKKLNIYLHAFCFFITDVMTIFFVGGAIYRYIPKFASYADWSLIKQLHIFGGIFVFALILIQHLGGVTTILSASKRNPQHKKFAFWVANLARVVVILGWILGGNQVNRNYAAIASAVLLLASFYNTYLVKGTGRVNPEEKSQTKTA